MLAKRIKIILPIILLTITGCAPVSSKEMLEMVNSGEAVIVEVADPSYEIEIVGKEIEEFEWVQLDQLKTYNMGFRQGFDEVFNIAIINENGEGGKSGCLFVDENGNRNGNSTLADALRNKYFNTKYWSKRETKDRLKELAEDIFIDVSDNREYALYGAINAYFNLLPNSENPSAFNPTKSLTREEFYALVFRSEERVRGLEVDREFAEKTGGETKYTKYAQGVDKYGFLSVANGSLNAINYKGSISRAEAVYLLVNKHFKDKLDAVTGKEQAYIDTKNAGDLALKGKLRYTDKETNEVVSTPKWQVYVLAYMMKNPDIGMHEEIYKAMVVAKELGLLGDVEESRWDEPLSKAEAIDLIVNTHLAKNKLYGYKSEVEFGKMALNKVEEAEEDVLVVQGVDEEGYEYGENWVEVPEAIVPVDPYEMLEEAGIPLAGARVIFDGVAKTWKEQGISSEEIERRLKIVANDWKTDYDKIMRVDLDEAKAIVEELQNSGNNSGNSETVADNTGGNTGSGSSGENSSVSTGETTGNSGGTSGDAGYTGGYTPIIGSGDYDDLPDWMKKYAVDGDGGYVPDLSGLENPFK